MLGIVFKSNIGHTLLVVTSTMNLCSRLLIAGFSLISACTAMAVPVLIPDQPLPLNASEEKRDAYKTSTTLIADFEQFLQKHQIPAGSIAISHSGVLINSAGFNRTAGDPAPVASLSKAITAVCTLKALELADESMSLRLGNVLADFFARHTVADDRLAQISIAQLIAHDSGIHANHMSMQASKIKTFESEQKIWQLKNIAAERLSAEPGSGFHYSNANYLILGLIIEELTGQDYETYCNKAVLQPIGISSTGLSEQWRIESSHGGWEISALDYLKFVDTYFESKAVMGTYPSDLKAITPINADTYYSLGTFMRLTGTAFNYWHTGSFTWDAPGRTARYAAFFAAYANGYSVSLNYALDALDGRDAEVDDLVYWATHKQD